MNTETGAFKRADELTKAERAAMNRDGRPLWVPATRANLDEIQDPQARARALAAIEKRERRAQQRKSQMSRHQDARVQKFEAEQRRKVEKRKRAKRNRR